MSADSSLKEQISPAEIPFSVPHFAVTSRSLGVAVVTADPEIRTAMAELLQKCFFRSIPASGFAELKSVCSGAALTACLCGFDLADGTFHDVIEYFEHQPVQIPVIMVSPRPGGESPARVVDSVRAGALIRAGALATICYPYRLTDVQIMLWFAIQYQREARRLHAFEQSTYR